MNLSHGTPTHCDCGAQLRMEHERDMGLCVNCAHFFATITPPDPEAVRREFMAHVAAFVYKQAGVRR